MAPLDRQIRAAQRRLWFNRWLGQLGWLLLVASCGWFALLLADRLFGLSLALLQLAGAGALMAMAGSAAWTLLTRDPPDAAAVTLDRAAGLKERISSGLYCQGSSDPFARAVLEDAVAAASRVSVRSFIPVRWSPPLTFAAIALAVVAPAGLLVPEVDLLGRAQAREQQRTKELLANEVRSAIAPPVTAVRQIVEKNPALGDLKGLEDLEHLARQRDAPIDPDNLRREAIKKLDRLGDELRQQAASERYTAMKELKKRLAEVGRPADPRSPVGRLMQALADGNLQTAKDELQKLQEKLATRDRSQPSPEAKQLAGQLDDLAKRLDDLATDKDLRGELQKAGVSAKDVQRTLDNLSKKDPRQIEKLAKDLEQRLRDKGLSQEQIERLKRKLKQAAKKNRQACKNAGDLAKKLSKAGACMRQGDAQGAAQQIADAAGQLTDLEMLEQELAGIEAGLSKLDDLKDDLADDRRAGQGDGECGHCKGSGYNRDGSPCPHCRGNGRGPGGIGRGGGERPRGSGEVDFVNRRAKVKSRPGVVIGQWYVKGEQIKGEARAAYLEATHAAIRDATDALEKDLVPRAYQGAVKSYFDRLIDDPADGAADAKPAEKP